MSFLACTAGVAVLSGCGVVATRGCGVVATRGCGVVALEQTDLPESMCIGCQEKRSRVVLQGHWHPMSSVPMAPGVSTQVTPTGPGIATCCTVCVCLRARVPTCVAKDNGQSSGHVAVTVCVLNERLLEQLNVKLLKKPLVHV